MGVYNVCSKNLSIMNIKFCFTDIWDHSVAILLPEGTVGPEWG